MDAAQNPMVGRRVFLRPVLPEDAFFLSQIASHPQTGAMWRWRGITPGSDPIRSTWPNVLAAFVVTSKQTGEPIALTLANNPDLISRTCALAYVARPDLKRSGWHLEAAILMINYLFRVWEMRKIYGEVLSYNVGIWDASVARGMVKEEGRLSEHVLVDGRYHDLVYLAVYRDDWIPAAQRFVEKLTSTDGSFVAPSKGG